MTDERYCAVLLELLRSYPYSSVCWDLRLETGLTGPQVNGALRYLHNRGLAEPATWGLGRWYATYVAHHAWKLLQHEEIV